MDHNRFTPASPGRLVPIEGGELSFLPNPLPPSGLELSTETLELLGKAQEGIGEIRGLTAPELIPNPGILLRPIQREESLRSSSLEGTYATAEELLRFELGPEPPSARLDDDLNPRREVHNHVLALRQGEELLKSVGLTAWTMRALHSTLLSEVRGQDKSPGQFRVKQVFIGSSHRFIPPPPHLVNDCVEQMLAYWANPQDRLHPIIRAALFHYQFETIHPFLDGNGRIGRLLLALMLADKCDLQRPWLYLSAYFERHKDEYVDTLFAVSAENDWESWIKLCLRAIAHQAAETISTLRRLIALQQSWLGAIRRGDFKLRTLELIERLLELPVIDTSTAAEVMKVAFNTARADLEKLEKAGMLSRLPDTDPQLYAAHEVIRIVHT